MLSDVKSLLTCSLQRYLTNSVFINQFVIFLSIYFFTFILDWYNYDAISVEDFSNQSNKKNNMKNGRKTRFNALIKYLINSIIVYVIFIISTKNEGIFIVIYLCLLLILTLLQTYVKTIDPVLYKKIYKHHYITQVQKEKLKRIYNDKDLDSIIRIHNITFVLFVISNLVLIIGIMFYYNKKKQELGNKFNFTKFLFGTNKCRN